MIFASNFWLFAWHRHQGIQSGSSFHTLSGQQAVVIGVSQLFDFGNIVRSLHQGRVRIAAGKNDFSVVRLMVKKIQKLIGVDQTLVQGADDFIENEQTSLGPARPMI